MAVTSVTREVESSGSWNRFYARTYTLVHRIECDNREDGPVTIRLWTGSPSLPSIGNSYYVNATEKDLGSFASDIRYQRTNASANPEHATWIQTTEYTPYDTGLFSANPVDWPVRLRFTGQTFDRVVYVDKDGNAIVNSAKQPFADPTTDDDGRSIIVATWNVLISSWDFTLASTYNHAINNAAWNGFDTGTVRCGIIETSDPQYDSNNQVYYYTVTAPFQINPDGWSKKPLDQGFTYLDGSSPPRNVDILDKYNQKVSEPQLLDGSGHVLASSGTPVVLEFKTGKWLDFSVFNLNFNLALGK